MVTARSSQGRFASQLTEAERRQVALLVLERGFSVTAAARTFGIDKSTSSRIVNGARKEAGMAAKVSAVKHVEGRYSKTRDEQKAALISAARSIVYRAILQQGRVGAGLDELREVRDEATAVELLLRNDTFGERLWEASDRLRLLDARLLSAQSLHALAPLHGGHRIEADSTDPRAVAEASVLVSTRVDSDATTAVGIADVLEGEELDVDGIAEDDDEEDATDLDAEGWNAEERGAGRARAQAVRARGCP